MSTLFRICSAVPARSLVHTSLVAAACLAIPMSATAQDYESEPRELLFEERFDAFDAIEFDTGDLPSGSPVAVRFYLWSKGGSSAEMEAISHITWPDSLTQHIEGVPGTGLLEVVCDLELAAQVTFDIWGYKGAYDVWRQELELEAETTFDPLLLDGDEPRSVSAKATGTGTEAYSTDIPLFAGLELRFNVQVYPQASAELSGSRIETGDTIITNSEVGAQHDLPEWDPGVLELSSVYVADVTASLEAVLQPQLELCAPIFGCFRVARFDIPIPLVDETAEQRFSTVRYSHPLPSMEATVSSHDFGEVEVGTLANLQLPLTNVGQLDLEGWLRIEGDGAFTVFPEYIQASQDNTDGAVITFAPTTDGPIAATLVIESNDPARPELRIPMGGNGWVEPELDPDDPDNPRLSGEVRGCGCDSASSPTGGLAIFGLAGLLLGLRRRRR
ncbi:MAG: MYXO-CTERM sorting domain-containing protein [Myxococcota bacterium]